MNLQLETILSIALGVTANALTAILWWWFMKVNREIDELKKQMLDIRLNYLNRFDDLKTHISQGNLLIIERLSKLEVYYTTNTRDKNDDKTG